MPGSLVEFAYGPDSFQPLPPIQREVKVINKSITLSRNDKLRVTLRVLPSDPYQWHMLSDHEFFRDVQYNEHDQDGFTVGEYTLTPHVDPSITFAVSALVRFMYVHISTSLGDPDYPLALYVLEFEITIPPVSPSKVRKPRQSGKR